MRLILPIWMLLLHMTCAWGLLIPDGTTDESVYDAENRLIATIDREGVVTLHRFDALGRQTHTFTHFTGDIHSTALPAPGTYAVTTLIDIVLLPGMGS